ncbi:hypothetical protein M501DRAFT_1012779 [Patellaria atrata CBS 101060]|uniref:Uncharacterized protein n=1 Tax=Patellaria atrata CBS 101060 TaxID=1346257 RepID=A0A9P4SI79_9PEZI|nr:hypothetical protein M501DRAFT_1012779 [Patellaria atrata CBS 101060]
MAQEKKQEQQREWVHVSGQVKPVPASHSLYYVRRGRELYDMHFNPVQPTSYVNRTEMTVEPSDSALHPAYRASIHLDVDESAFKPQFEEVQSVRRAHIRAKTFARSTWGTARRAPLPFPVETEDIYKSRGVYGAGIVNWARLYEEEKMRDRLVSRPASQPSPSCRGLPWGFFRTPEALTPTVCPVPVGAGPFPNPIGFGRPTQSSVANTPVSDAYGERKVGIGRSRKMSLSAPPTHRRLLSRIAFDLE